MYNVDLINKIVSKDKSDFYEESNRVNSLKIFEAEDYPKWNRVSFGDNSAPEYEDFNNQIIEYESVDGLLVLEKPYMTNEIFSKLSKNKYGVSKKHLSLTNAFANAGTYIEVDKNVEVKEPVIIRMNMDENNSFLLDRHTLIVKSGASVTVVLEYINEKSKAFNNSILNIVAEPYSNVHVVKSQSINSESRHIFSGISLISREATVNFNSVDLGSGAIATNYNSYLNEERANSYVDSIYIGDGNAKLDLAYSIFHVGQKTNSNVSVHGALLENAKKVFRSDLHFEKGASTAHGAEEEYVILLDDTVHSDAIPGLFCHEDDVKGEHAASAGQIDENKLFYLKSRGLSEKKAKQIIIMASFADTIDKLPLEKLKEKVNTIVGQKLDK